MLDSDWHVVVVLVADFNLVHWHIRGEIDVALRARRYNRLWVRLLKAHLVIAGTPICGILEPCLQTLL